MHLVEHTETWDAFPSSRRPDDIIDRRDANRAIAFSAVGLATAFQDCLLPVETQAKIRAFRTPAIDQPIFWPAGRNNQTAFVPTTFGAPPPGIAGNGTGRRQPGSTSSPGATTTVAR